MVPDTGFGWQTLFPDYEWENTSYLCCYKVNDKGKLTPPYVSIGWQGEGSGVAKIILAFLDETDH